MYTATKRHTSISVDVITDDTISPTAKILLIYMLTYIDTALTAKKITADLNISDKDLRDARTELKNAGYIRYTFTGPKSTTFRATVTDEPLYQPSDDTPSRADQKQQLIRHLEAAGIRPDPTRIEGACDDEQETEP